MKSFIAIADKDSKNINELTQINIANYKEGTKYPISWKIDSTRTTILNFKGYEGKMIPSNITGSKRLKYNRNKPFTKEVIYYNYFEPLNTISIPEKYIIPKGWWKIKELLKLNKIKITYAPKDTVIIAGVYKIKNYETVNNAYEGHYMHYKTKTEFKQELVQIRKGDYIVSTQQEGVRYILETLEPSATDSFFNWNFFDTILQQKEGFSPYVWEDMAVEFLENHPKIKMEFEAKKLEDPEFSENWYEQLDWIHKQSPNYEKSHLRYPIIRVGG